MSPAVKPDCSKLTAGIKIMLHFRRMLLQCSNGDLQFALCYGIAMRHWWRANCSVLVALCITAPQQLCFAVCTVQVTLYTFQRITGDFQFALCKLRVSVLPCSTDDQFGLCKLYQRECNATQVTCNLWCITCVIWGTAVQLGEFQFALYCIRYYMLALHYRTSEIQFALSQSYYVILQCRISDL